MPAPGGPDPDHAASYELCSVSTTASGSPEPRAKESETLSMDDESPTSNDPPHPTIPVAETNLLDEDDDPDLERRTVRKLDWILLPFLSVLFCLNSLDRTNVGSAESAHFTRDTGLAPNDLNTSVALFYVFFVVLQPFGAALGRKFGMGRYVPSVMALWGVCTTLHIWVNRRWQLLLLRSIIGILEAGFYPTTVSYLSLFYTRYEFGRRLGFFYGQAAVAGAIGGILAFVVFSMFPDEHESESPKDRNGWKSWQVLFLTEGLLTVVIAVLGLVWLPRSAVTAWFLSPKERIYAEERVQRDRNSTDDSRILGSKSSSEASNLAIEEPNNHFEIETTDPSDDQRAHLLQGHDHDQDPHRTDSPSRTAPLPSTTTPSPTSPSKSLTSDTGLSPSDLLSSLLSLPLLLYLLVCNILSALPSTAFSVFLPLILSSKHMSSTPRYVNLLTAPPFLLAALTLFLFTSWSDRHHSRINPILAGLGLTGTGLLLVLLIPSTSVVFSYLALCILLSGSFIASPLTVAWLAGNVPEPGKRAIVLGINGWGNLAGILSSLLFAPRWRESGYKVPLGATLVAVAVAAAGFAGFRVWLVRENARRGRVVAGWDDAEVAKERKGGVGGWGSGKGKGEGYDRMGLWERWVREYVGRRVLGMDGDGEEEGEGDVYVRRGDEKLTFRYGL